MLENSRKDSKELTTIIIIRSQKYQFHKIQHARASYINWQQNCVKRQNKSGHNKEPLLSNANIYSNPLGHHFYRWLHKKCCKMMVIILKSNNWTLIQTIEMKKFSKQYNQYINSMICTSNSMRWSLFRDRCLIGLILILKRVIKKLWRGRNILKRQRNIRRQRRIVLLRRWFSFSLQSPSSVLFCLLNGLETGFHVIYIFFISLYSSSKSDLLNNLFFSTLTN